MAAMPFPCNGHLLCFYEFTHRFMFFQTNITEREWDLTTSRNRQVFYYNVFSLECKMELNIIRHIYMSPPFSPFHIYVTDSLNEIIIACFTSNYVGYYDFNLQFLNVGIELGTWGHFIIKFCWQKLLGSMGIFPLVIYLLPMERRYKKSEILYEKKCWQLGRNDKTN